jgi:ferrous iron transport protein A
MRSPAALRAVHHVLQVQIVKAKNNREKCEPMKIVALRNMEENQSGVIKAIKVNGELGRRLREMGLTPGTRISVCGRAPLRDPVAIRVLNSILTLRNNEAEYIHVEIQNT